QLFIAHLASSGCDLHHEATTAPPPNSARARSRRSPRRLFRCLPNPALLTRLSAAAAAIGSSLARSQLAHAVLPRQGMKNANSFLLAATLCAACGPQELDIAEEEPVANDSTVTDEAEL